MSKKRIAHNKKQKKGVGDGKRVKHGVESEISNSGYTKVNV